MQPVFVGYWIYDLEHQNFSKIQLSIGALGQLWECMVWFSWDNPCGYQTQTKSSLSMTIHTMSLFLIIAFYLWLYWSCVDERESAVWATSSTLVRRTLLCQDLPSVPPISEGYPALFILSLLLILGINKLWLFMEIQSRRNTFSLEKSPEIQWRNLWDTVKHLSSGFIVSSLTRFLLEADWELYWCNYQAH